MGRNVAEQAFASRRDASIGRNRYTYALHPVGMHPCGMQGREAAISTDRCTPTDCRKELTPIYGQCVKRHSKVLTDMLQVKQEAQ
jgi:hypothetical protein